MHALRRIRPSSLVLLTAAPFIFYLFATNSNYQRSLIAILGIEADAPKLLFSYATFLAMTVSGLVFPVLCLRRKEVGPNCRLAGNLAAALNLLLAAFVIFIADSAAFVNSVVANAVDPFKSLLIIPTLLPRRLTPEAMDAALAALHSGLLAYVLASVALLALATLGMRQGRRGLRIVSAVALLGLNAFGAAYLLFAVHAGFADGLATTLRAAVFAYVLAAFMGLGLAGMQRLGLGRRTLTCYAIFCGILLALSAGLLLQPKADYVLVGSLQGRVAIVLGTPESLVDSVRFGRYEGAPEGAAGEAKLRSVAETKRAIELIQSGSDVTGALLPAELAPPAAPVLWRVSTLPDRYRVPAALFGVAGILFSVLTFGAFQHRRHPLAVGSEFFVDTVRGIPMLVIILYIGLPIGGAVKDATGGAIDLSAMTRGIFAMAVAYSAYLAEIFRAGIEAVPRGQIEAARSVGLSNWQVARLVVLPQALRVVIPPLGNEFIAILKDTSLLSILSVRDVTQRMREFQSASFLPFAPFNATAILYVVLTLAAASGLKWIERRYDVKERS